MDLEFVDPSVDHERRLSPFHEILAPVAPFSTIPPLKPFQALNKKLSEIS